MQRPTFTRPGVFLRRGGGCRTVEDRQRGVREALQRRWVEPGIPPKSILASHAGGELPLPRRS